MDGVSCLIYFVVGGVEVEVVVGCDVVGEVEVGLCS